jgi:hypothetical protein
MRIASLILAFFLVAHRTAPAQNPGPGLTVDKAKNTVTIDAVIAPRKLEHLKEVYPIEVIACWAHPKGKKAHETIVNFDVSPSKVHKALEELGAKAGAPVMGDTTAVATGAELKIYLEVPTDVAGETRKLTMDKCLLDTKTGKAFPKNVKWLFTGSKMIQTDPNKPDKIYGADDKGTLIVIFPVSDETVVQSNLEMKLEKFMKLDTNTKSLPKTGTPVKLVLEVVK